jgi:septal ring factor EnvC (AmiA/AmiB activator)
MSKTSKTLVEKIKSFLKLGDDGKLQSFFDKQEKFLNRSIKNVNADLSALETQHEIDKEHLEEQLQDAQEAVEAAYMAVTAEDVSTNEKQIQFQHVYWRRVEEAEVKVKRIQRDIKSLVDSYSSRVESLNSEISGFQTRLNIIKGE